MLASSPVASDMRLAARPVGAASAVLTPEAFKIFKIVLMIVVLPVPGPPVMTDTPFYRDEMIASFCRAESSMPVSFSLAAMRFQASPVTWVSEAWHSV